MSNAAYNRNEREGEARNAMLREWGLDRPQQSADVVSLDAKRKPLGLAPVIEPDDDVSDVRPNNFNTDDSVILHDGYRFSFMDGTPREVLDGPATVELVYIMGNSLRHLDRRRKRPPAEPRLMGAELRKARRRPPFNLKTPHLRDDGWPR